MVNLETFVNFICPQLMLTSSLLQPKRLPFLKRYILAFTERNAQISYIYYLKTILACSGSSLYHIAPRRALPCQRNQSADAERPTAEKSSSRARPKIFPNILIVSTLYSTRYFVVLASVQTIDGTTKRNMEKQFSNCFPLMMFLGYIYY